MKALTLYDPAFAYFQLTSENFRKRRLHLSRGILPYFCRPNHKKAESLTMTPRKGCWLKYQLNLRKITQEDVAQKAGVSQKMVSHFITGRKNSEKVKKALADVLGYPSFEALIATSRGKEGV
jgi:DNA-binding XRE family transcriptional regulator